MFYKLLYEGVLDELLTTTFNKNEILTFINILLIFLFRIYLIKTNLRPAKTSKF